jgi:hypothetical protein
MTNDEKDALFKSACAIINRDADFLAASGRQSGRDLQGMAEAFRSRSINYAAMSIYSTPPATPSTPSASRTRRA